MKGKKIITIYDVAREANTSIATVSKALNRKSDISEDTRKRILHIVGKMGFSASRTAASISRKPRNIIVLFPDRLNNYAAEVLRGIEAALEDLRDFKVGAEFQAIKSEAADFIQGLEHFSAQGFDGAILIPPKNIDVFTDALKHSKALAGFPIATVITDIDEDARLFCVQCNARASGRMAAELLSLPLERGSRVAFVTDSKDVQVHKLHAEGFFSELDRYGLVSAGIYEHFNVPERSKALADRLVREHPDLKGLYLSSAVTDPFLDRLKELGALPGLKIVASGHFPKMVAYVRDGSVLATIFQNPRKQGCLALRYMYEYLTSAELVPDGKALLFPQPVFRSNLEHYERLISQKVSNTPLEPEDPW